MLKYVLVKDSKQSTQGVDGRYEYKFAMLHKRLDLSKSLVEECEHDIYG